MKRRVTKETEFSFEEAKNEFMSEMDPSDLSCYDESEICIYIGDNMPYNWELTDDEEEEFVKKMVPIIKPMWVKEKNKCKAEESESLKCREDIIEWLDDVIYRTEPQEGMIGYALTSEEILDLILKNGNK